MKVSIEEIIGYLEHLLLLFCETIDIIDMEKIEKVPNGSDNEDYDSDEEEKTEYWTKAPNFELMVIILNELIFFID